MRTVSALLAFWFLAAPVLAAGAALPAPPAPDYGDAANWAAGPGGPGASAALPAGATPAGPDPQVDVFFVHATTFITDSAFHQDAADAKVNAWTDASSIARQASAFSGCCRVFAPRYRQASVKAVRATEAERDAAYALAYTDVERAFDWFLAHHSKGRPFILAGHGQGARHVANLLERRIDGTRLQNRMVAAYVVGMNLTEGDFGRRYKTVRPCETQASAGCVLQWNAVLEGTDLAPIVARTEAAQVASYGDAPGGQTLCINPVRFAQDKPETPREASLGAVPGDPGAGPLLPLVAGAVAAKCDRGFLLVSPDPALDLKPLPGGSLHFHDIGLFWADIRADAIRRIGLFWKY